MRDVYKRQTPLQVLGFQTGRGQRFEAPRFPEANEVVINGLAQFEG